MGGFQQYGIARDLALPAQQDPLLPMRGMAAGSSLLGLLTNQNRQAQMFPLQMQQQQQENQMRQMQIDAAQQAQRDQTMMQGALQQTGGDVGKAIGLIYGKVSPGYYTSVQQSHAKTLEALSEVEDHELKTAQDRHSREAVIYGQYASLAARDPQSAASMWSTMRAVNPDLNDLPEQAPSVQDAQGAALGHMTLDQYTKQEQAAREQAQLEETTRHNQAMENKAGKLSDVEQYTQDYLAAHNLPSTPANRLLAHQAFTKETKTDPGVARLQVLLQRPTQVADPNNPGETVMVPQSQAVGMAGPSSASVQNPRAMGRYMTSGKGGQQLAMFDTAIGHAQQLGNLVDAMGNGNVRLLNQIGNRLGLEMGSDAVTNFNVVKTALGAEVERLFAGGVASEGDRRNMAGLISASNSPQQLRGAINQVVHLMQSRKQALQKQYQAGMQGQPSFGDNAGGAPADPSDPLGILPGRKR